MSPQGAGSYELPLGINKPLPLVTCRISIYAHLRRVMSPQVRACTSYRSEFDIETRLAATAGPVASAAETWTTCAHWGQRMRFPASLSGTRPFLPQASQLMRIDIDTPGPDWAWHLKLQSNPHTLQLRISGGRSGEKNFRNPLSDDRTARFERI